MSDVVAIRQRGFENGTEVSRLEAVEIMMLSIQSKLTGSTADFILDREVKINFY